MFSKNREPEGAAINTSSAPAKRTVRNGVPSIISAELCVTGKLVSSTDIQIDGKVDGDIRAAALVIGDKAIITGDVYADDVTIRGRINGNVFARKVQLCAGCHVEGNILHEALSIETGAFFEGNCRHSANPLADAPQIETMAERGSTAPTD